MSHGWRLGANYLGHQQTAFEVWAPKAGRIELHLTAPEERSLALPRAGEGYFRQTFPGVAPGTRYFYRLNGDKDRPDPASRFQPEGVHGPSEVIDPRFDWQDQAWFGLPLRDYILYELHVGTFTPEGTFDAVIPHLPELKELGITALELMPVAQFPGARNWGYDGVYPFAVQNSYGGPPGLKRLVNACHLAGLAVVLDVVYNHLGPEGNYLPEFGHYFNNSYATPWGAALNFDAAHSGAVRRFFIENALYWQTEFHLDALRLDAVHAIRDFSATPFLQELAAAARRQAELLNQRFYLIAESDLNNARFILPETLGGYGLDAQWSDDFHHCLHVLLTGERDGYYADFNGVRQFAKVWREGYAYTGEYSPYRRHRHGNSPRLAGAKQFVVYAQNHDQIGNRLHGDRLAKLADFETLKLAAGCVLLSPFIPLVFMGEEYGEPAPFRYVISHTDPALVEAVRQGRREEFAQFLWQGEAPDPFAEDTFRQCILNRKLHGEGKQHLVLNHFYQRLIQLRKELPAIARAEKDTLETQAREAERALGVRYGPPADEVFCLFAFADAPVSVEFDLPAGRWEKLLDSAAECWGGRGAALPEVISVEGLAAFHPPPKSLAVFQKKPVA